MLEILYDHFLHYPINLYPLVISFAQGDTKYYDLKKYLDMSETQYAILTGPSFSILFVISGIVMVINTQ